MVCARVCEGCVFVSGLLWMLQSSMAVTNNRWGAQMSDHGIFKAASGMVMMNRLQHYQHHKLRSHIISIMHI
jgi:hypothetical protein